MKQSNENIIGNNLKKLRRKHHYTQETFALQLNVSRQAISSYECGAVLPDILLLKQIADLLNISLDVIVGRIQG